MLTPTDYTPAAGDLTGSGIAGPLSSDRNAELCCRIREGDDDAFEELIRLHCGLTVIAVEKARRRVRGGPGGVWMIESEHRLADPLRAAAILGLWHAALAWPGEGAFGSYALVSMVRAAVDEGRRLLGLGDSLDEQDPEGDETPADRLQATDPSPEEHLLLKERLRADLSAISGLLEALRDRRVPSLPATPRSDAGQRSLPGRRPCTLQVPAQEEMADRRDPESHFVVPEESPYGPVFDSVAEDMRLVQFPRELMEEAQDDLVRRLQGAAFSWTADDGSRWRSPLDRDALQRLREKGVLAVLASFLLAQSELDPSKIDRAHRPTAIRRVREGRHVHESLEHAMRRASEVARAVGDPAREHWFAECSRQDALKAKNLAAQLGPLVRTDRAGSRGPSGRLPSHAVLRAEVDEITRLAEGEQGLPETAHERAEFVRRALASLGVPATSDELERLVARIWTKRAGHAPPVQPFTLAAELVALIYGVTRDRVLRRARRESA